MCELLSRRIYLVRFVSPKTNYLSTKVIVEQFESCELFIHGLRVLGLLFLHNLATCLDHGLHL